MNVVILCGKLQKDVRFDFIYNNKHVSIAKGKIMMDNGNMVNIYGYDDIADFLYRNEKKFIWLEGCIRENGVEAKEVCGGEFFYKYIQN